MTVTETVSATKGNWIHFAGTIQEVLNALVNQGMTALNVVYWSDDGTDAKAVACRFR